MKIPPDLNDKDNELYHEIYEMYEFFKNHEKYSPEKIDHSKFYLIFAYNLIETLNLEEEGQEMLENVSLDYLENEFIDDIQKSVASRNEALALERRLKYEEASLKHEEAEFFLVAIGALEIFKNSEWISETSQYKIMMDKLKDEEFVLKNPPKLDLLEGGKDDTLH